MFDFFKKYQGQVYLGLIGLILLGIGVLAIFGLQPKEPDIEIISSEENKNETIFIDLQGAVEKTGVYEMSANSRLNDLLIKAGGLNVSADRVWINQNLNLAQKLIDGGKIYIPFMGEVKSLKTSSGSLGKLNLNTATNSELEALWGIGQKRAEDIVKSRPYQTVEELIKRKIIPQNVYDKIKDEMVVY
jgi:competence protein ComEA